MHCPEGEPGSGHLQREHAARAARTYGAAADHYLLPDWGSGRRFESSKPALFRSYNPWDEITTESALVDLLARGGIGEAAVEATTGMSHKLAGPHDFWDIVLGSGFRATVDAPGEA